MIRLLRVELARLLARRAVLVLLAAAIVIPTVIGVARVLETQPPSTEEVAAAEQQAAEEADRRYIQRELQHCVDKPGRYGVANAEDVQQACEEAVLPRADWYLWYEPLTLTEERVGGGFAVVVVLSMLMLLVGTTFAGHDWASGSMSNQLLFEPRRLRVWAAKSVVVTAVAGLAAALVTTGFWLALTAVVDGRGGDAARAVVLDSLQMGWRGAAVAAGTALAGFALAMLFRSTVAALGVVAAVAIAGGIVLAVVGLGWAWDPSLNALAVVQDGATYWATAACPDGTPGCEVERVLPLWRGVTVLGGGLVVAVLASVLSFARRDVP